MKAVSRKGGKKVKVTVTVAGAVSGVPTTGTVRVGLRGGLVTRTVTLPASGKVTVTMPTKAKGKGGKLRPAKVVVRTSFAATGSYSSSKASPRTVRLK